MNQSVLKNLLISMVCLILAGCNLSGTITDENGKALSGITVVLSGSASQTVTTNTNGQYTFSSLNSGSYTVTPQAGTYMYMPVNTNVTIGNSDVTGINFTGISQNHSAWSYSHTFDDGPGPVTISGAEINNSTTRTFTKAGLYGYSDDPQMDNYGIAVQNYKSTSFAVSEVPYDSYSEIVFKFKQMNVPADIKNSLDLVQRIPIYFQIFRAKEPNRALIETNDLTTGAFVDKNNNVIFHFGGKMFNMGPATDWWNAEVRQVLKFYGDSIQAEIYKNGTLVKYAQVTLGCATVANGTNLVTFLSQGVTIRKISFTDQMVSPFVAKPIDAGLWYGELYSDPSLTWNYWQIFNQQTGEPTIEGAKNNDSATRIMMVNGYTDGYLVRDSYGITGSGSVSVSEVPQNFRAEVVMKNTYLPPQSEMNKEYEMLCLGKKVTDSNSGLDVQLKYMMGEIVLMLLKDGVPIDGHMLGYSKDWLNAECRLVIELFNDYLQIRLYKNSLLVERYQTRSINASSLSGFPSVFSITGVSVKEYRFAEINQAPFSGSGENTPGIRYLVYQDFTKTAGILSYNPPTHRFYSIVGLWNWMFPASALSPDLVPSAVEGVGLMGTQSEFEAYMTFPFYGGPYQIETTVEWPLTPDANLIFELGYHNIMLQYVQATQTLNLVDYGKVNATMSENCTPFPAVTLSANVINSKQVALNPGQLYKFGIQKMNGNVSIIIDDVTVLTLPVNSNGDYETLAPLRGVNCNGLHVKSFGIKPITAN